MNTSNGKPVVYTNKLLQVWKLTQGRQEHVKLVKVKAHKKGSEKAYWNNKVNSEAKQGAKKEELWKEVPKAILSQLKKKNLPQ